MAGSKVKHSAQKSWTQPDGEMTTEQFVDAIKKAESGHFHSIQEGKKILKKWRTEKAEK